MSKNASFFTMRQVPVPCAPTVSGREVNCIRSKTLSYNLAKSYTLQITVFEIDFQGGVNFLLYI